MAHIVTGTFDGHVMLFDEPPPFPANTRLVGTLEQEDSGPEHAGVSDTSEDPHRGKTTSLFEIARSMQFEGPPDLSARLDHYLYGVLGDEEE